MNARSIHVRLVFWYTVLIICASVGFGVYTYDSLRDHLYQEMHTTLARRIEHIRDDILPKFKTDASGLKQQIEQVYSPEDSNRFVRITQIDGPVLYVSGPPQDHSFNPVSIAPANTHAAQICERTIQAGTDTRLLLVGCGVISNSAKYVIEMGAPITEIDSVLHKLIFTLLIGMPMMALIAIAGGSFLVRRALQPVENIRATAEKITFSNVSQRLPVTATGDALENLSITLNQMLERLEHAYQQASRFSADASHELRTPLTIIRSELESIQSTLRATQLPVPFQDRIGSVLEETERLSRIVEGLFALARLDAGEAKMEHIVFDLARLIRLTVEQMQLLADEKRLSVSIEAPQPVFVMGDATRLKQVIINLLDNSIKYTMPGGTIEIAVRAENSKAVLSIRDNGIGISADALPFVFERFYRADKARSQASAGAGLGLSIVRAICQAHGGTVCIDSVVDTVTMVTVELPIATAGRV